MCVFFFSSQILNESECDTPRILRPLLNYIRVNVHHWAVTPMMLQMTYGMVGEIEHIQIHYDRDINDEPVLRHAYIGYGEFVNDNLHIVPPSVSVSRAVHQCKYGFPVIGYNGFFPEYHFYDPAEVVLSGDENSVFNVCGLEARDYYPTMWAPLPNYVNPGYFI